jgi:hypothetical protein
MRRRVRLRERCVQVTARAFVLLVAACTEQPVLSTTEAASTVGDYEGGGCTTEVVLGLSRQIAEQAGCSDPNSFVTLEGIPGIAFDDAAVLPFLVKDARDDLAKVAATSSLEVSSALRTVAQQYLLYRWYEQGLCGITAAATPGTSNHEGGRAVDLDNYADRIDAMAAFGWAHDVPGDDVHFDHTASADDRGQDIAAFQTLWNANHPTDVIDEDGEYGPETEARLVQAPATGFATGPSCDTTPPPPPPIKAQDTIEESFASPADADGCNASGGSCGLLTPLIWLAFRRKRRSYTG